jgi:hypothetical protein
MTDLSQKFDAFLLAQKSSKLSLGASKPTMSTVPRTVLPTPQEGTNFEETIAPHEEEFFVS